MTLYRCNNWGYVVLADDPGAMGPGVAQNYFLRSSGRGSAMTRAVGDANRENNEGIGCLASKVSFLGVGGFESNALSIVGISRLLIPENCAVSKREVSWFFLSRVACVALCSFSPSQVTNSISAGGLGGLGGSVRLWSSEINNEDVAGSEHVCVCVQGGWGGKGLMAAAPFGGGLKRLAVRNH